MDYLIHSHISHILKANPNRQNVVYAFFPKEFKKDSVYHYSMKKRKKIAQYSNTKEYRFQQNTPNVFHYDKCNCNI